MTRGDAARYGERLVQVGPDLVGYGPKYELPCAVIVSSRHLTLQEVRGYLDAIGMTGWYQPTRLEQVDELPCNPTGKVDKLHLRTRLASQGES